MDYSLFRESERAGWSDRASIYGDATAKATLQTIPTLLAHADLFPGAKILDTGCGPGFVAACAHTLGADVEGIDFSSAMVEVARCKFPNLTFKIEDVEELSAKDEIYDAVLSNIVLFHVTDPARAMAEAYRVLKPGGKFVFSQWLGPDQSDCYRLLFDVLGQHADMSLADPAPDAYALSNKKKVTEILQKHGFVGIRFERVENVLHVEGRNFHDFFMKFGVRVPLILSRQKESVRKKIQEEVDRRAIQYLSDGKIKIPMPSLVISADRPIT